MGTPTECRLFIAERTEHLPRLLEFARAIGLRLAPCPEGGALEAPAARVRAGECLLEVSCPGLDVAWFVGAFAGLAPFSPVACLSGFGGQALLLARVEGRGLPGGSALDFAEALQLLLACSVREAAPPAGAVRLNHTGDTRADLKGRGSKASA